MSRPARNDTEIGTSIGWNVSICASLSIPPVKALNRLAVAGLLDRAQFGAQVDGLLQGALAFASEALALLPDTGLALSGDQHLVGG